MLKSLHVKNIALISDLQLELERGLNVLSGETGAGKSIIIDSLAFLLGERADKTLIRYGEEFASVEGVFEIADNNNALIVLSDMGIETDDGVVIIYRKMSIDGKNDIRVNGHTLTLAMLKSITDYIADIYGQHEHQTLLNNANHIKLVDKYGYDEISVNFDKYSTVLAKYKELKSYFENVGDEAERERKADVLRYQIDEIERANLKIGEEEELESLRTKIVNTEKIIGALNDAIGYLSYNGSVSSTLSQTNRALNSAIRYDETLSNIASRIESCEIEIKDIEESLKNSLSNYDFSPTQAKEVEDRHDLIRLFKRKYGNSVEQILTFKDDARAELDKLESAKRDISLKEKELSYVKDELYKTATTLSNSRRKFAKQFEKIVMQELSELGLGSTTFEITFNDIPSFDQFESSLTNNGFDNVIFMISPNKGEPLRQLSKIASGGEMSRFMLACKKIIASLDGIETMVFDEVDTGISGKIAQIVSQKLYNIASLSGQVIAVTHLPQLSAMSDAHFLIEKFEIGGKTLTTLKKLSKDEKELEVARLAGAENNEHSLIHAREIIEFADNYKSSRL